MGIADSYVVREQFNKKDQRAPPFVLLTVAQYKVARICGE